MRQVVLDTETTGLDWRRGHRVIEIGCIEVVNRRVTGEQFQAHVNPHREVDPEAYAVHGLSDEFLRDQPDFSEIAQAWLAFIQGAELVIHNAEFDVGFLNAEIKLLADPSKLLQDMCQIHDTLDLARRLHPGQRNSLDALSRRYGVDGRDRTHHGALLDAQILADVYLAMTGGQTMLHFEGSTLARPETTPTGLNSGEQTHSMARSPLVVPANENELIAHRDWLRRLGVDTLEGES